MSEIITNGRYAIHSDLADPQCMDGWCTSMATTKPVHYISREWIHVHFELPQGRNICLRRINRSHGIEKKIIRKSSDKGRTQ